MYLIGHGLVVGPQLLDHPLVARHPVALLVHHGGDEARGREQKLVGLVRPPRQFLLEQVLAVGQDRQPVAVRLFFLLLRYRHE